MNKLNQFRTITQAEVANVAQGLIDDSNGDAVVTSTVQAMLLRIIAVIESPRID